MRRRVACALPATVVAASVGGCDRAASPESDTSSGSASGSSPASPLSDSPSREKNFLSADATWYREQLLNGNVRPRLKAAVASSGFYAPNIARNWTLKGEQRGTLITQSRAIYVASVGYEVTGEAVYRDALVRTADFLLTKWRHPTERGLWAKEVSPDGKVLSDEVHRYGQMQAIFALAHAFRSTQEKRFLDAALNTWLNVDIRALVAGKRPDYTLTGLNVAMHTFEAMFALHRAAPSKLLFDDVTLIAEHILKYFLNEKEGFFYEHLNEQMQPLADGEIRVGHNFEMAFLFSRAVASGLHTKFLDASLRVVNFLADRGISAANGSVPHELSYRGTLRDPQLAFWCHTEALRSLAHFAVEHRQARLQPRFDAVLAFAKAHFIDDKYGGWYRVADQPDQGKGSDWFAGYHEAMMSTEILRLTGYAFKSGPQMLL